MQYSLQTRSCQVIIVYSRYRLLNCEKKIPIEVTLSYLLLCKSGLLLDKVTLTSFVSVQLLYVQIFTLEGSQRLQ